MRTADRGLMWHGMFLFELVMYLNEQRFRNMRMALSARVAKAARWSGLYGTYGNWLFTTLGAAMGTAAANPVLSQGHHGKPWQERLRRQAFAASPIRPSPPWC